MTTMTPLDESQRKALRTAGLLYFLMVLTAPIGLLYVPGALMVEGDAAATADRIRESGLLLRVGIASELFHQVVVVFLALTLYRLFGPVDKLQARLLVVLGALVSVPIMFVNVLNEIAALIMVSGAGFLSAFDKTELDALAYLFFRLHGHGIDVASIFWGLWLFPFGILVIRSGFIPRLPGYLLFVAGTAYLVSAFTTFVLPEHAKTVGDIALIFELGEMPIVFWFLFRALRPPMVAGKTLLLILPILFLCGSQRAAAADLPAVTRYRLDARFMLKERKMSVAATLTVRNITDRPQANLPFVLYRLLTVDRVRDGSGSPLSFTQDIVQLSDEPSLQAREVVVTLASPIRPNDSTTVVISYGGFVFGYPEVMAYVKDRIDEKYTLLRPDAFAWPVLAEPSFKSTFAANDTKFDFEVTATVPSAYTVACGGALVDTRAGADSSTFTFRNTIPTWRIDLAVAKFSVLRNTGERLSIYHMPEDSTGAANVLAASKDAVAFYDRMFGPAPGFAGYTVIEIPDGWGSQAGDGYLLQSAAAFKDSSRISEVYHEIGHSWNATAAGDIQRCRYFDEAFASFFEALAVRSFRGEKAFEEDMEKSRDIFIQWGEYDRKVFDTPIAGYGAKELGRHSYTKGAWSLYVLYRLTGEKAFASIIRSMLQEFGGRTIDFEEFRKLCERVSGRDLGKFFQEWIYGTESSRLLLEKAGIEEILKRYGS